MGLRSATRRADAPAYDDGTTTGIEVPSAAWSTASKDPVGSAGRRDGAVGATARSGALGMRADRRTASIRRGSLRHGALIPVIESLLDAGIARPDRPLTTSELQAALGRLLGEEPALALVHEAARTLVRRRRIQSWAGPDGILRYRSLPRPAGWRPDDEGCRAAA